jgi:hypothetical protein
VTLLLAGWELLEMWSEQEPVAESQKGERKRLAGLARKDIAEKRSGGSLSAQYNYTDSCSAITR